MTKKTAEATGQSDEVLEALDALLGVLRENTKRNEIARRRAQTIRRLRNHGRSYHEIMRRVEGALTLGVRREDVEVLMAATDRLSRTEVRALHDEHISVEEIAALCGETREWVAALLPEDGGRGHQAIQN